MMSQNEHTRRRDKNRGSNSSSENSNVDSTEKAQLKRRCYHRHTVEQIQEMEAFFEVCPHPDEDQRIELSQQLGMEPHQVKFWFQNKRTQMKSQHGHKEINQLRTEIENLRTENLRFREALSNASCFNCGVRAPLKEKSILDHQLRPEIDQMEAPSSSTNNGGHGSMVVDLGALAMEELMRVAELGEPLWIPSIDRNSSELNEDEYLRAFSRVFTRKTNGFKCEASRESVVVAMCATNVIEILMNVEQWANVFSGVVSRAMNLHNISSGLAGTYNQARLLVKAEYQVPSPLVSTRESCFLRYCKRHLDGRWGVVDVSIDHLHTSSSSVRCRRRPSGCLIQDIGNGYSEVTWVEHVEVEDVSINHSIYMPLISCGLAFGAPRWLAILHQYSQRLLTTISLTQDANNFLGGNQDGRRNMLKLGERMVARFCGGVSMSITNPWTTLSGHGNDSVKLLTRTNEVDPTLPFGVLLNIATSFWLPVPPKRVFDFLCDQTTRKEWDTLLNGGDVEELTHILSGKEENRVTLYQVKGVGSSPSEVIVLQESRSDPTASYVVYAPIDMVRMNAVILGGVDPSHVPLLPSGFAILPDGPIGRRQKGKRRAAADTGGSLLTIALQILMDSTPNAKLSMGSVAVANKLMWTTVNKIKQALIPRS